MGGSACRLCPATAEEGELSSPSHSESDIDVSSLVLTPRLRHFPVQATKHDGTDGECLLFLERAHNLVYDDLIGNLNCQAGAGPSRARGRPFVRAWAQDEHGDVVGKAATWPAKSSDANPSWYSARPLGFSLAKHHRLSLHIELWEDRTVLGSLALALSDIPFHVAVARELHTRHAAHSNTPCQVSFQILESHALSDQRVVYFVRHGESVWNKAQDSMQIHEMARTVDHPLSPDGRRQAEALSRRLAHAAKQAEASVEKMLRPDAVYVSPLSRAIQTAVIALGPMMTKQSGVGEMVLMPNAREKQNFGGLDTKSNLIGADVLQNSLDELRVLYKGEDKEVLDTFAQLRFDAHDVRDLWWCDGISESPSELKARMQDFMSQLLYSPHKSMIVVGHSHFFRSVFKAFLSDDFCLENKELARAITSKKLMNCGVARVELDPKRGTAGGPIVGVELVLDTQLDADRAGLLACCTAPQHSAHSTATSLDEEVFSYGEAY